MMIVDRTHASTTGRAQMVRICSAVTVPMDLQEIAASTESIRVGLSLVSMEDGVSELLIAITIHVLAP